MRRDVTGACTTTWGCAAISSAWAPPARRTASAAPGWVTPVQVRVVWRTAASTRPASPTRLAVPSCTQLAPPPGSVCEPVTRSPSLSEWADGGLGTQVAGLPGAYGHHANGAGVVDELAWPVRFHHPLLHPACRVERWRVLTWRVWLQVAARQRPYGHHAHGARAVNGGPSGWRSRRDRTFCCTWLVSATGDSPSSSCSMVYVTGC